MSVDDHAGAASRAHGQLDVVEDAVCLGCGCTCDDIRLRIQDDRIVAADMAIPDDEHLSRTRLRLRHPVEST